jgi:hypothetical protein
MIKCKKHEKIKPEDNWFDNLVKYLVGRNLFDGRIDQNILEDLVRSFAHITYKIPRFVDLLPILCSTRQIIDEFDNLPENYLGPNDPMPDDAVDQLNTYVLKNLKSCSKVDLLFVECATYVLVQFEDFRDCVQVLSALDQHCGEYQSLLE